MTKPTKKPKPEAVLFLRLPPELKAAIVRAAAEGGRTVPAEARRALMAWVAAR